MSKIVRSKNIFVLLISLILIIGCKHKTEIVIPSKIKPDSVSTISFAVVGDLMCHSTQYNYAKISADSFYFDNVFKYVKPIFDSTDFVMGNFESVTAGDSFNYRGYPIFNTPDDFITSLKRSGFDILFTANNHCYDQKQYGLKRTIKVIKENNLHYSGTFDSLRDADSIRVYNKNGIDFALLSYSYSTNGFTVPAKYKYSVNIIDTNKIKFDVWKAKKHNPDLVILYFHFGNEYSRTPSKNQKKIVEKAFKYGADIILASHPHVLQPIQIVKNNYSKLDSSFVTYSLGNFISNQRWRYADCGVIVNFNIHKNHTKNIIHFENLSYLPTWVFKGRDNGKKEYYILPTERFMNNKEIDFLTVADRDSMAKSLLDTKKIINKYSKTPKQLK